MRAPGRRGNGLTAYQRAYRAGFYGQGFDAAGVRDTAAAREAYNRGREHGRVRGAASINVPAQDQQAHERKG